MVWIGCEADNDAAACRAFEISSRREALGFSHHVTDFETAKSRRAATSNRPAAARSAPSAKQVLVFGRSYASPFRRLKAGLVEREFGGFTPPPNL